MFTYLKSKVKILIKVTLLGQGIEVGTVPIKMQLCQVAQLFRVVLIYQGCRINQ